MNAGDPKMTVRTVPVLDTGIGREMGYANDAEFMSAAEAKREEALSVLTLEGRRRLEDAEREAELLLVAAELVATIWKRP